MSAMDTAPTDDRWILSAEAARLLRCTDRTVRRYAECGYLPSVRLPSGRYRFQRVDVLALLVPGDRR